MLHELPGDTEEPRGDGLVSLGLSKRGLEHRAAGHPLDLVDGEHPDERADVGGEIGGLLERAPSGVQELGVGGGQRYEGADAGLRELEGLSGAGELARDDERARDEVGARDEIAEGGRVEVRAAVEHEHVVVHVIDNGSGIPPEIQSRIFDPFFTTKPVGKGTGIGLDMVRKLLKHNNAQIEVESRPGRTDFTLTLPLSGHADAKGVQ